MLLFDEQNVRGEGRLEEASAMLISPDAAKPPRPDLHEAIFHKMLNRPDKLRPVSGVRRDVTAGGAYGGGTRPERIYHRTSNHRRRSPDVSCYDEDALKHLSISKEFKRGRVNLNEEFRNGRPSNAVNNKKIDAVRHMIETDRHDRSTMRYRRP
ncbi:hypothetical protein EVAR_27893_1 [Eumeta japonica]|uniref:Uncharacterized protein n=1 Tax=Eumeta variegata TaxID=151549 RepID=A0A4C1UUX4_EUMVA|nr:hypothetical protein EVAR_27893_1 [Eumeta japonica]